MSTANTFCEWWWTVMACNCESLFRIRKWSTYGVVDSPPADSAAWLVKVFKCKHQSKHRGKGGGDKHQLWSWPQARPSLLPSMHSPQHVRKHWGGRGGIKHRLRFQPHGCSISILLTSVHALDNKLGGFCAPGFLQQCSKNMQKENHTSKKRT